MLVRSSSHVLVKRHFFGCRSSGQRHSLVRCSHIVLSAEVSGGQASARSSPEPRTGALACEGREHGEDCEDAGLTVVNAAVVLAGIGGEKADRAPRP